MSVKKIFILAFLFFFLLSTSGVFAQDEVSGEETENKTPSAIEKLVKEKTPAFVTKTIEKVKNTLEGFRIKTLTSIQNKKEEIQVKIGDTNIPKASEEDTTIEYAEAVGHFNILERLELTMLTVAESIFKSPAIFYGIIIMVIVLFILRLI